MSGPVYTSRAMRQIAVKVVEIDQFVVYGAFARAACEVSKDR